MPSVEKILDTEIPPPSFSYIPSRVNPLASDLSFARASEGVVRYAPNPDYRVEPADTPRIHGKDGGLLLEEESTNFVRHSSDMSKGSSALGSSGNVSFDNVGREIIGDADADSKIIRSGGANNDRYRLSADGSYSGAEETVTVYLEKASSGSAKILLKGASVNFSWNADSASYNILRDDNNIIIDINTRTDTNPNTGGTPVLIVSIAIDTSNISGEGRYVDVGPNSDVSGDGVVFYHAQIEDKSGATAPIVTSGGKESRQRETVTLDVKDEWWNKAGSTFLVEFVPHAFRYSNTNAKIIGQPGEEWINIRGNSSPYGVGSYDGSNVIGIDPSGNLAPAFEKSTAAMSVTSNERRLALNGAADTFPHNGSLRLKPNSLELGTNGNAMMRIVSLRYIPAPLPKSALEIITS